MVSILQELQISSIDKLKNEKFIKEKLDGGNPHLISKMLLMMYSMDKEIKELTARIDKYENSGSVLGVEQLSSKAKADNNSNHANANDGDGIDHSNDNGTADDYDTDNDNDNDSANYSDNDTDEYIDNGTDTGTDNSNDIDEDVDKDIVNEINDIGKDIVNDLSKNINDVNDISEDINDISKDTNNDLGDNIGNNVGTDIDSAIVNDANNDIGNNIDNNTNNDVDININNNNNIGNDKDNSTNANKLEISNSKNTYIFNDEENKIVKRLSWPNGLHVFKTPISFSEDFCSTMNENIKKNGRPWPEISLNQLAIKFKIPKDMLARTSRKPNAGFKNYNKQKTNHYNSSNSKSEILKRSKQLENKRNIRRKLPVVPKTENKDVNDVKSTRNTIRKRPKKLRITRSRIQSNRSATDDVESSSESVSDPNAPSSSEDDAERNDDDGKHPPYINDNVELKSIEIGSKAPELPAEQPVTTLRNSAKRNVEGNDEEKPTKVIKKPKNCKIKQENKAIDLPISEETRLNNLKTHSHLSMAELLNHTTLKLENSDTSNDSVSNNKKTDDHHKIGPAYISQTHILNDQTEKSVSFGKQPEFKYTVTEKGFFKCDTCVANPQIFLQYIDLYRHKQLQHQEEFPKYVIH